MDLLVLKHTRVIFLLTILVAMERDAGTQVSAGMVSNVKYKIRILSATSPSI